MVFLNFRTRDEMCGENGEILQSPALAYKLADFERSVETLRVEKKAQELPQDEDIPIVEKKDEAVESQSSQVCKHHPNNTIYIKWITIYIILTF